MGSLGLFLRAPPPGALPNPLPWPRLSLNERLGVPPALRDGEEMKKTLSVAPGGTLETPS